MFIQLVDAIIPQEVSNFPSLKIGGEPEGGRSFSPFYPTEIMEEQHIESWFPTPLYVVNNMMVTSLPQLSKEVESIIKQNISTRNGEFNVDSVHKLSLQNELFAGCFEFQKLKNAIQKHVNEFCESLNLNPREISNIWFNVSDQGDYNFPHIHNGSVISGVFYIESPPENYLRIYNPHYITFNFPASLNPNEYTYSFCDIPCIPGRLLMWPAHMLHGNPKQEVIGRKIAVSFNTI